MEYSKQRDAVFCYPCRQFARSIKTKVDSVFVTSGFSNWKCALYSDRGFSKHSSSESHLLSESMWKDKVQRTACQKEISFLVNGSILEKRRYYFTAIIDVIRFLVENELALRGNWDALNGKECGLFNNLFEYTLKKDNKLKECHDLMPDVAKYTSPSIQNEIIGIMARIVRCYVVSDVNHSQFFTLFLDGTKDKQRREILSIGARFIKDGEPTESLLGFEHCNALDAESLANVALKALDSYGVDKTHMVCQCYDGANVMSGENGGVRYFVNLKIGREIPYVHCFNHRLHLVIVSIVSEIPSVYTFFDQINVIYKFFQRYKVKDIYCGSALKRLIDTRWAGHLKATKSVFTNLKYIAKSLSEIKENQSGKFASEDVMLATGLLKTISQVEFVFLLNFFKDFLELIEPVDKLLQSRSVGFKIGKPVIDRVIADIDEWKFNDVFESCYQKSNVLLDEIQIDNCGTRITRQSSIRNDSNEKENLHRAFQNILDLGLNELNRRFQNNSDILLALDDLYTFERNKILPLEKIGIELPSESELKFVKRFCDDAKEQNSSEVFNYLKHLFPLKTTFQDTYKMLEAAESFGSSTAICEASFSTLSRIDIVQRMSMTSDRLKNLTFLAFERTRFKNITSDEIMREFDSDKNPRIQLF